MRLAFLSCLLCFTLSALAEQPPARAPASPTPPASASTPTTGTPSDSNSPSQGLDHLQQILQGSKDAGESAQQSNSQGLTQTAMGTAFLGTSAALFATAASVRPTNEPKAQTLETLGVVFLMQGLSQIASGATSFAQSSASQATSEGNQGTYDQRSGGGSGSNPGSLQGNLTFDADKNGVTTPAEVETALGPNAQANLQLLDEKGLKDSVLEALASGQNVRDVIRQETGLPIPDAGDWDSLKKLSEHNDLVAESLSSQGLPYDDVLRAVNDPQAFVGSSGSASAPLTAALMLKNPTAAKEAKKLEEKTLQQFSAYARTSEGGNTNDLHGSAFDAKKYGLNLKDFLNKKNDLEAHAFGKGQTNFLNKPGISNEIHQSIFTILSRRYGVLLTGELTRGGYIVNGELRGMARSLDSHQVQSALKDLRETAPAPSAQSPRPAKRVPTFVP